MNIKQGDVIVLNNIHCHNSDTIHYNNNINCVTEEIGENFIILSIKTARRGGAAYEIKCKKGITYLRRDAFTLAKDQPLINEDMSYLISFLQNKDIK